MPLIKDGARVEDVWVTVPDDAPLPADAPAIVILERWLAERAALLRRNQPLGIRFRSDQPPAPVVGDLDRLGVIALEFPKFTDGRAYSYARLLRERHGYRGELRAVGNVLRDQFLFMHRCGFDAFEVADEAAVLAWGEAMAEIAVWYQPTGDGRTPAAVARRRPATPLVPVPRAPRKSAPSARRIEPPDAVPVVAVWAY